MLYDKEKWEKPVDMTPKLALWQQTLLDAADWLERHRWIQRKYRSPGFFGWHKGACMVGAIGIVQRNPVTQHLAQEKLSYSLGGWPITLWNDVGERTKDEVLKALRKAAKEG